MIGHLPHEENCDWIFGSYETPVQEFLRNALMLHIVHWSSYWVRIYHHQAATSQDGSRCLDTNITQIWQPLHTFYLQFLTQPLEKLWYMAGVCANWSTPASAVWHQIWLYHLLYSIMDKIQAARRWKLVGRAAVAWWKFKLYMSFFNIFILSTRILKGTSHDFCWSDKPMNNFLKQGMIKTSNKIPVKLMTLWRKLGFGQVSFFGARWAVFLISYFLTALVDVLVHLGGFSKYTIILESVEKTSKMWN